MSEIAAKEPSSDVPVPDPTAIAEIQRQLVKLRDAGMLSPEGRRLLAQAEAVEVANREMAEVKGRLEARLRQIEKEADEARKQLQ